VFGGGIAPFTWSVTGLPPGMSFRSGDGITSSYVSPGDVELWGSPTALGNYNVTVKVVDVNGLDVTQIFPLHVSPLLVDNCISSPNCVQLPAGAVGTAYATPLRVVGGVAPYSAIEAASRNIPAGVPASLWPSATAVTGIPQENGQFLPLFTVT